MDEHASLCFEPFHGFARGFFISVDVREQVKTEQQETRQCHHGGEQNVELVQLDGRHKLS